MADLLTTWCPRLHVFEPPIEHSILRVSSQDESPCIKKANAALASLFGPRSEPSEALATANSALVLLQEDAPSGVTTAVHIACGVAHAYTGQHEKSWTFFEQITQGIALGESLASVDIDETRIWYAQLLALTGRIADARHQLELVLPSSSTDLSITAALALARTERELGDTGASTQRLAELTTRVPPTSPWYPLAMIEQLALKGKAAESRELEGFLSWLLNHHELTPGAPFTLAIGRRLRKFLYEHPGQLLAASRLSSQQRLIELCGAPIRWRLGLIDAADATREELERLFQANSSPLTRLNASLLLASDDSARSTQRQKASEHAAAAIETIAADALLPGVWTDTSFAQLKTAKPQERAFKRVVEHLDRAQAHADTRNDVQSESRRVARLRCEIRYLQLERSLRSSQRERQWGLEVHEYALRITSPHRDELLKRAALALMRFGALSHPGCLDTSLALVKVLGETPAIQNLQKQISKLRDESANFPSWVRTLLKGQKPEARVVGERDIELLELLRTVRPDLESAGIKWFSDSLSTSSVHGLADSIMNRLWDVDGGPLRARLLNLLDRAHADTPSFSLLDLRVRLLDEPSNWGDDTPYGEAVRALKSAARTPNELALAGFRCGVERINAWQELRGNDPQRADSAIREARSVFDEAVSIARQGRISSSTHFALLVSAGNAYRHGRAKLGRAIELYQEADKIGAPSSVGNAKLCKVWADALVDRNGDGDAGAALEKIEAALEIRKTGHLRDETLRTAARVEMIQPNLNELTRNRRAVSRIEEALEHCLPRSRRPLHRILTKYLGACVRLDPKDRGSRSRLNELAKDAAGDAELAEDIARALQGGSGLLAAGSEEEFAEVVTDPSVKRYLFAGLIGHPDSRAELTHAL